MYRGKRILDLVGATVMLGCLLPVFAVVALGVRLRLGAPVLFRQTRPGLDGVPFDLVKFRTMTDAVDEEGRPLPDAQRTHPFGQLLRRTSLDELPELLNVLRGEMSLVGPRPLLMQYLPLYNEDQRKRHLVRPGLTGLAQVSGRNSLSWDDRFGLDCKYTEKASLRLDLHILIRTAVTVLTGSGVKGEGVEVGALPFMGNEQPAVEDGPEI